MFLGDLLVNPFIVVYLHKFFSFARLEQVNKLFYEGDSAANQLFSCEWGQVSSMGLVIHFNQLIDAGCRVVVAYIHSTTYEKQTVFFSHDIRDI